ncbi:MAG: S8 family serine peptidase [Candidatus Thermoplasmatota archaeon]|nr:S8 family serine peptidase [Candidatus Thermoplasmatota archaeon]
MSSSTGLRRSAILICLIFLLASYSAAADSTHLDKEQSQGSTPIITHAEPILVDGLPPLMCGDELCERPLRIDMRGQMPASEKEGWWLGYGPDLDWNGMDDRLQRVLAGSESISPTSIIGEDGKKTVAIVVDYAWHPTDVEVTELKQVLQEHNWLGEESGAWFDRPESIDSIVVDKVPVSALMDIYHLNGVVVIEMQNVMVPSNDIAGKATRAMPSDVYSETAYERGYSGDGVVIAVLDTGVDNEHRSLNDFDDQDDAPDTNPLSYDDHKWVAGYDATSAAANPDGTQDPDDGQGHGTHVAGSALGTGDSSRVHVGTAPGAYLVDIKVLTDTGGTNSQYSINGIQWMINNAETDWGHNSSSRGIQIGSMSFGSLSSPLNPGDEGDNGTGGEARLINNATENADIVCVIAMGNDGSKRVPSPASADLGFAVASASDFGTVNRTNDGISSFSNFGPRLDDGDDNEWDELKPDIASYGSNIISATAATGTSFPGAPRPEADTGYDEKDGTSMATPIASGIIALVREAAPSLTALEVMDVIRNSSEIRDKPANTVSDRWHEKWGFGLIDASCAIDLALNQPCTALEDTGVVAPPPSGNGTGDYVIINQPTNNTWWLEGNTATISGTTDVPSSEQFDQVQIRIAQFLESGTERELKPWTIAGGDVDDWTLNVNVLEDWIQADEEYVIVSVKLYDTVTEAESNIDFRVINLARMKVTIASPNVGQSVSGIVEFSGTVDGVQHDYLEYKVDNGEWEFATDLPNLEVGSQDWSYNWDSTTVSDGSTRLSFRMVNESGVKTDDIRRTIDVDNMPAAPDFVFTGVVEVLDEVGLPVQTTVAGSILTVRFTIENVGDLDADDVYIKLDAPGDDSDVYPSDITISNLNDGDESEITLYLWATEVGSHTVTLTIDPSSNYNDPNPDDNSYSFPFEVEERPVEPTLRFMQGAYQTVPLIPTPGQQYTVIVRVDNLGQTDAAGLALTLYGEAEDGWNELAQDTITIIPGSYSSSGYDEARFIVPENMSIAGGTNFRVTMSGDGVETEYSELRFTVVVNEVGLDSPVRLNLISGEEIIDFVGMEDSGLLFTTVDGELHVRTVTESSSGAWATLADVKLADSWAGELTAILRDDGLVHAAWTENVLSQQGYFLSHIAMTSITSAGETTEKQTHMTALKLSEGRYWGLDMAKKGDRIVLAGYHRDIATGGSYNDITSIFVLMSDTPHIQSSWSFSYILSNIDIKPSQGDSLAIDIGEENMHILYQELRDDVTGIERVGLMYAHGKEWLPSWSFQYSVGDYASNAQLEVYQNNGRDVLAATWIEGFGGESKIAFVITDNSWSAEEPEYMVAAGVTNLVMSSYDDKISLIYDEINVYGPMTRYGLLDVDENEFALSNLITEGFALGYATTKEESITLVSSSSGTLSFRTIVSLETDDIVTKEKTFLEALLEPLPGDETTKAAILIATVIVISSIFLYLVVSLRRSNREGDDEILSATLVTSEDDVEIMVEVEADDAATMAINMDAEELVVQSVVTSKLQAVVEEEETLEQTLAAKAESGEGNSRLERRMRRKQQRELVEITEQMISNIPQPMSTTIPELDAEPIVPEPSILPPLDIAALPLPPIQGVPVPQKEAYCLECSAKFTIKDLRLTKVNCPICDSVVEL